ncbi:hypothetical protein QTL95_06900 [Rhizobium sp. S152]|uniref:hypothetical protein n=1 Tax=Rhizobium sp. S152 TaxID=3055038 RepID=UPI0025A95187|nr:hypothetical protein [Rhizobium sp. S152]MDM9625615.1 hypothetical protein [Rhizobium sp. S152]
MPGNANMVTVWEKDPSSGRTRQAPKPDVNKLPLGFYFPPPEPPVSDDTDSEDFRYWVAAEALRRGADFWTPCLAPPPKWAPGNTLQVRPDTIYDDLNSDYDGAVLTFSHGSAPANPGLVVYAGATPDILCHELGHAVLHALNINLWPPGGTELEAFKESFGDMSAILCALQVSEFRDTLLAETQAAGNFWISSSLSRVAEQFGKVVRAVAPEDADKDCLRNAWNHHNYEAPATIANRQGPDVLTVSSHSFSRVFTGAFYEAFAAMFTARAANKATRSLELQIASTHMRDILAASVVNAQRRDDFFAHVAARMVDASAGKDASYPAIFTDVFTRRSILPGAIA